MQQGPSQRFEGGRRTRRDCVKETSVSVITAVYNGEKYIAGCLESVLQQDYPDIEHIVLDGGSTDQTVDILRQYDDRVEYWASEPDNGVYDAWNKGLAEARGNWICFLGADDEFLPGAISAYMKMARDNPQAEYLSSQVEWVHESGYSRVIGEPWDWKRFSRFMCVAHPGSMHRRSLFDRLGSYDCTYRRTADYELLLRARGDLQAAYLPISTVMMRAGGVSDSTSALSEAMRAKVLAGGRGSWLAAAERLVATIKFYAALSSRKTLAKIQTKWT